MPFTTSVAATTGRVTMNAATQTSSFATMNLLIIAELIEHIPFQWNHHPNQWRGPATRASQGLKPSARAGEVGLRRKSLRSGSSNCGSA